MSQVWHFTFACVMEGESKEDALASALAYLQEQAERGTLEPSTATLLEEDRA